MPQIEIEGVERECAELDARSRGASQQSISGDKNLLYSIRILSGKDSSTNYLAAGFYEGTKRC